MDIELSDEQEAIADHPLGKHGRVIAGPGTGKSLAAVELAYKLLTQNKPKPCVKFITFTRAATAELAKKLSGRKIGDIVKPSTLHSFSVSVLLQNKGCADFPYPLRIPNDVERDYLIYIHLAKLVGVRRLERIKDLIKEMSSKWTSLSLEENPKITPEERAKFLGVWGTHRQIFGYTLLAELPDLFRCALRDHSDLTGIELDLIIVDEYQDLNACDIEVLSRLKERGVSVIAIGDDKQSIYSSLRKADPAGILNFPQGFKPCREYPLTKCYRLPRKIFEWAQFVIQGSLNYKRKNQLKCLDGAKDGEAALLRFNGAVSEAKGIANLVSYLVNTKSIPPSEILILSRADYQGMFLKRTKEELKERNIPLSETNIKALLNDNQHRHLLALLHIIVNKFDSLAWWALLDMQRMVGPLFISYIYEKSFKSQKRFGEVFLSEAETGFVDGPTSGKKQALELWKEVNSVLSSIELPFDHRNVPWGEWILEQIEKGYLPKCSDDLRKLLLDIDELIGSDKDLGFYLGQIQPLGKDILENSNKGVRCTTMIGAKGLTVKATIVVGVDSNYIPHPYSENPEEERRLLYVSMTRSTDALFLTWASRRKGPQARAGSESYGKRQHCRFLHGGPVESVSGEEYIRKLMRESV